MDCAFWLLLVLLVLTPITSFFVLTLIISLLKTEMLKIHLLKYIRKFSEEFC